MLIDTHCHLSSEKYESVEEVIKQSVDNGVEVMVVPTTSISDLEEAVLKLRDFKNVFLLAGVHPEDVEEVENVAETIGVMRKIIEENKKKIVGIGEIGLDFYYDKEKKTKKEQMELFTKQMELAVKLDLPVAIHMREAEEETLEVMRSMKKLPRGQFHCFGGTREFLKQVLDWGYYVSFAGNITFKSASDLRERLSETPQNRLLLETDSPYLSPEPVRGTVNEPKNVKILAEFIARALGIEPKTLADITTNNAKCLYSLDI